MPINILNHLAVIMDGNRRWATKNKKSIKAAYTKGAEVIKELIKYCIKYRIKHLTLYAFSEENWMRPKFQVSLILSLMKQYLLKESGYINDQNIKLNVIGNLSKLTSFIQNKIKEVIDTTKNNTVLNLYIAFSYGGKQEIVNACKNALKLNLNHENLDIKKFNNLLYQPNMPDVDLLIRTGGYQRLSNFLLWQTAYSELYFSSKHWPDFLEEDLCNAIKYFYKSNRTFGVC